MEQQFGLIYNSNGGISYRDVLTMSMGERNWFINRLNSQIREENKAREKANKGTRGKKLSMPKTRKRR